MDKHMDQWLGAYLDGELSPARRRQVANHLESCPQCQAELEALSQLSSMLKADPLPETLGPAARFSDQVALQLERRPPAKTRGRSNWRTAGWWLVPVGVLGVWVFLMVASVLTTAAGTALQTGLISELPSWVAPPATYGWWSSALLGALNGSLDGAMHPVLQIFGRQELFWTGIAGHLLLQVILIFVYWSWLAGWLLPRRRSEVLNTERSI